MDATPLVNPRADADAATPSDGATRDDGRLELLVARKELAARDVWRFELRDPAGRELPPFAPGAHLPVTTPSGALRNYSICSNPAERHAYVIAVKREPLGRGGSIGMADRVQAGQVLQAGAPRNEFALADGARSIVFVAGGIGITPILSMMRHLKASEGARFRLVYLARDPQSAAFLGELEAEFAGAVTVHHDHGRRDQAFDLWPLFAKAAPGAHVYCCGPRPLMDAVRGMTGHWKAGTVHFESFGIEAKAHAENRPFRVHLQRTGIDVEVRADESILDALRVRGIRAPSSCEAGTCGSCRTRLLAGEADHRDAVLSEEEQSRDIMICVSRARSDELVLDL